MALNIKIQTFRGTKAALSALASTGFAGVLAWTTDTNELFVDTGSGTGIPTAWAPIQKTNQVFTVASQAALTGLTTANTGDFAIDTGTNVTYILTTTPNTVSGNWVAVSQPDVTPLGAAVAHEWLTYIDSAGIQHLAQPAFSDISGLLAQTQLPTTIGAGSSLTNIDAGTF